MIIAHRGVSFKLPENSIPAFEASWQFDVDGIEGDFHLTKDGEIVCIHDDDTERVWYSPSRQKQLFPLGSWAVMLHRH